MITEQTFKMHMMKATRKAKRMQYGTGGGKVTQTDTFAQYATKNGVSLKMMLTCLVIAHIAGQRWTDERQKEPIQAGEEMIRLTVDGVCKECPLRSIKVLDAIADPIARCEHQTVCKYIEKEGYKDTTTGKKTP